MEQSNPKKPATAGSWKPGQSGNSRGRPPSGFALSDAMKHRFPPERIAELAEKLATTAVSEQVRLAALQMIAERTHGKVANVVDASITNASAPAFDLSGMDLVAKRELLDRIKSLRVTPSSDDYPQSLDATVTEGQSE